MAQWRCGAALAYGLGIPGLFIVNTIKMKAG